MRGIARASSDWPAQLCHDLRVLVQKKQYFIVFESPKEDVLFANTISDVARCFRALADPCEYTCRNAFLTEELLSEQHGHCKVVGSEYGTVHMQQYEIYACFCVWEAVTLISGIHHRIHHLES